MGKQKSYVILRRASLAQDDMIYPFPFFLSALFRKKVVGLKTLPYEVRSPCSQKIKISHPSERWTKFDNYAIL